MEPAPGIIAALRDFDGFGRRTQAHEAEGIPYFVNEFWTARQRQGHALQEISYRACFKPQLPAFFIDRLTAPGDTVHDPFAGRGTTPLQAALMGRHGSGCDINPLAAMLVRPRLRPPAPADLEAALATVDWSAGRIGRPELDAFYHRDTLRALEALRVWLAARAPLEEPAPDRAADWLRMVALNRLSGHSSGFFSGRSMPPNQAVSLAAQRRINARLGTAPPPRDIPAILLRKSRSLMRHGTDVPGGGHVFTAPAEATPQLPDGSVDLVVTSPPFLDVVHYRADNWLRCWFAGIDPDSVAIAQHRDLAGWTIMIRAVLSEQARLLRPGGHVAFEVGEVRGGRVALERAVWEAAAGLPFARLGVMINDQAFTKTANCWGVVNGTHGTNTNRIVLLRRR